MQLNFWILSIVAVIGAIVSFGFHQRKKGRANAKREHEQEQAELYQETSRRINQTHDVDDADIARGQLHERVTKRGL